MIGLANELNLSRINRTYVIFPTEIQSISKIILISNFSLIQVR